MSSEIVSHTPRRYVAEVVSEAVSRVIVNGSVVGYVESVGRLFVALEGPRLDRACEVGQCFWMDDAIELLAERAHRLSHLAAKARPRVLPTIETSVDTSEITQLAS